MEAMEQLRTRHEVTLGACAQEVLSSYQEINAELSNGVREFDDVFAEKRSKLEAAGQHDLAEFMTGMLYGSGQRDEMVPRRMCIGAFYAYEALDRLAIGRGFGLPIIKIEAETFRDRAALLARYGALVSDRPDIAKGLIEPLRHESSRQGAIAMLMNFDHIISRRPE